MALNRAKLWMIITEMIAFEEILNPVRPTGQYTAVTPSERFPAVPTILREHGGNILECLGIEGVGAVI